MAFYATNLASYFPFAAFFTTNLDVAEMCIVKAYTSTEVGPDAIVRARVSVISRG
jgi:hypothetical protein